MVAPVRVSFYDIENDMIIASKIDKYKSSEKTVTEELINAICNIGKYNSLILFDRVF